jgi:hypothetical protein
VSAVDWHAVPGHPRFYRPETIESGLRDLAAATGTVAAARAASDLDGGSLVHGHSGAVMPAAALAAPTLLDVMEHGHPEARRAAWSLLTDSLRYDPIAGYPRVSASWGLEVPICCAIAHHVHTRREALTALGDLGRSLLADAAEHWLFEIGETTDDGADTIAFGTLHGTVPVGRHEAECHTPAGHVVLGPVCLEYPVVPGEQDGCLRLFDANPRSLPPHAVLLPAECGRRVH